MYKNIEKEKVLSLKDLVDYSEGQQNACAERACEHDRFFV